MFAKKLLLLETLYVLPLWFAACAGIFGGARSALVKMVLENHCAPAFSKGEFEEHQLDVVW